MKLKELIRLLSEPSLFNPVAPRELRGDPLSGRFVRRGVMDRSRNHLRFVGNAEGLLLENFQFLDFYVGDFWQF